MGTIKIHRNNSGILKITVKKKDGTAWNVPLGNGLQFTVKKSVTDTDEEIIFFKTGTGDGGNVYSFTLTGADTDLMPGNYKWDIKDTTANQTFYGGDFKILEVVLQGDPITGQPAEITETEAITEVSAVYYEKDYNELKNKPQINSHTLKDNLTGADLGLADLSVTDALGERVSENEEDIAVLGVEMDTKADKTELPEKLSDLTNDEGFVSETVIDSKDATTLNSAKAYTDAEITDIDIPTKTSDLTNDSGFITSAYHDSTKQDTLIAGPNIIISSGNVISATGGGSGDTWELIAEGSVTEPVNTLIISEDKQGNDFNLKKFFIVIDNFKNTVAASASYTTGYLYLHETIYNKKENLLAQIRWNYEPATSIKNRQYTMRYEKVGNIWTCINAVSVLDTNSIDTYFNYAKPIIPNCDLFYLFLGRNEFIFDYKVYGVRV